MTLRRRIIAAICANWQAKILTIVICTPAILLDLYARSH